MTSNENMLNYICSMTSITKRKILKRVCKIITMVISKLKMMCDFYPLQSFCIFLNS